MISVGYVTVKVTDQSVARDFFVNAIGWEVVEDTSYEEGRLLIVASKDGETGLVLSQVPLDDSGSLAEFIADEAPAVWMWADDLDGTYEELTGRGVFFPQPPQWMPWGNRMAVFADPSGNSYALTERPAEKR